MTVTSSTSKSRYTGNGVTLAFTGAFPILDEDHVLVTHTSTLGVDTVKTTTTDYTVSGVGGSSFTVTHLVAPASGVTVTLSRNVPATQELDLVENDDMPANELEKAFDKVTMLFQQSGEAQDRSLKFPVSDSASLSAELPSAANRVGYLLGFDSNGEPTLVDPTTGFAVNANVAAFGALAAAADKVAYFTASDATMALASLTTFGRSLIDDADAAAGRTTLGLGTAATQNTGAFDAAGSAAAAQAASQPLDTDLTAIAGLTSAANKMPYATGSGTWALTDITASGRALVGGAQPLISVHRNGADQGSVSNATFTKVAFTTEARDVGAAFDNATNYRWTPQVAGDYEMVVAVTFTNTNLADQCQVIAAVYKNGSAVSPGGYATFRASGANYTQAIAKVVVAMNGTTDYLEGFGYADDGGSTKTIFGDAKYTFMQGKLVG